MQTHMMKTLLAVLLAVLAFNARAQQHFIDGNVLYEKLQRKDPSAITYILGVYDAMQIVQIHSGAERYFCAPPAVTGIQLVDAVRGHMEADPEVRSYPAGVLVLRALIIAFPCPPA